METGPVRRLFAVLQKSCTEGAGRGVEAIRRRNNQRIGVVAINSRQTSHAAIFENKSVGNAISSAGWWE
jgi:hypothetical protein